MDSSLTRDYLKQSVLEFLETSLSLIRPGRLNLDENVQLLHHLHFINIPEFLTADSANASHMKADISYSKLELSFWQVEFHVCVFKLHENEISVENSNLGQQEGEEAPLFSHLPLPHITLSSLWDSLVFPSNLKDNMFEMAQSILTFNDLEVDQNLISYNRLLFFYGPPGSGKSSLSRALCQRLSYYRAGCHLIVLHASNLFSKYFSESGKQVSRVFTRIHECFPESDALFIVIDELESVACDRSRVSASDPSDSYRGVNSLLTTLDAFSRLRSDYIVLASSNIMQTVDSAMLDRCDAKIYLGPPAPQAMIQILASATYELVRVGVVCPSNSIHEKLASLTMDVNCLSCRFLRKAPFLATCRLKRPSSFDAYLCRLKEVIVEETRARNFNVTQK